MPRRFRPRITYANVAATLALVLALGGVSYAATQINGKNIKNRTVGAAKIKENVLGGTEINEAKLGKVPSAALTDNAANATNAAHATNADTVGGQPATAFKLTCPQDTTLAIGQCFEPTLRAANTWTNANKICGAIGRRVPTIAELDSARQNNVGVGTPPNNYELSASYSSDNTNAERIIAMDPNGNRLQILLTDTKQFRCIQSPTN